MCFSPLSLLAHCLAHKKEHKHLLNGGCIVLEQNKPGWQSLIALGGNACLVSF